MEGCRPNERAVTAVQQALEANILSLGHNYSVRSVALAPDGTLALSFSADQTAWQPLTRIAASTPQSLAVTMVQQSHRLQIKLIRREIGYINSHNSYFLIDGQYENVMENY